MNLGRTRYPDADDFFADTRMSFGDHLEDLRLHLWRAITGFCIGLVFGFIVCKPVLGMICAPIDAELKSYWDNYYKKKAREVEQALNNGELDTGEPIRVKLRFDEQALKELGLDNKAGPKDVSIELSEPLRFYSQLHKHETIVGRRPALATFATQEGFLVWVKVSMVSGFVLASPWIFYQIWSFIAAGLFPHEKRYVNLFLPVSIGLFLVGVVVCQFFVIPKAIASLMWFNEWLGFEPEFRLSEWLSFAILMPLVFGLSFQTPLVMLFLERLGILSVESFRRKRGIAWFVLVLFAAIVLPSMDVGSLLGLWIPLGLLYELGILMCVLLPKRPAFDIDVPESDELIEV